MPWSTGFWTEGNGPISALVSKGFDTRLSRYFLPKIIIATTVP